MNYLYKRDPSLTHDLAKAGLCCPGDQLRCLGVGGAVGIWYLGGGAFGDPGRSQPVSKVSVLAEPIGWSRCMGRGHSPADTEGAGCRESEEGPNLPRGPGGLSALLPNPSTGRGEGHWSETPSRRLGPQDQLLRTFQNRPGRSPCFRGDALRRWSPGGQPRPERGKGCPRRTCACTFDLHSDLDRRGLDPGVKQQEADTVDGQIVSQLQRMSMEEPAPPINAEMEAEEARLSTFTNWPASITIQPPPLARAGFFYTGHRDNVKCFHCDGGLRNWEPGDDPWMEHAKWFPRCEFLLQVKGRDYVNRIQELHSDILESAFQGVSQPRTPARQGVVGNTELSPLMRSAVVQSVLQMGFDRGLIESLVDSKFLLTGAQYSSVSDLLADLLGAEEEERERRRLNTVVDPRPREAVRAPSERREPAAQQRDLSAEEQLRQLKNERTCKVCMDKEVSIVFIPCGHLVVCRDCAPNLRRCPICRALIRGSVRAFMS
uniref:baculoviral IAP repeat-containing protein 7-like n=1 Tax=Pristiophorus japonicus TaxID=55135 RepID=UPI00398F0337